MFFFYIEMFGCLQMQRVAAASNCSTSVRNIKTFVLQHSVLRENVQCKGL